MPVTRTSYVQELEFESQIGSISTELSQLAARLEKAVNLAPQVRADASPGKDDLVAFARNIARARKVRVSALDPTLLGEPAWDIVLDLFVAHHAGEKISVTSACLASGVPASTALRWLKHLEAIGEIESTRDPTDGRRVHVSLTPAARERMVSVLTAMREYMLP